MYGQQNWSGPPSSGAPSPGAYGQYQGTAPPNYGAYGAPGSPAGYPPSPNQYGAPQSPAHQAYPPQQSYGAPQQPPANYAQPPANYGAPQQTYGAPQQPANYAQPQTNYGYQNSPGTYHNPSGTYNSAPVNPTQSYPGQTSYGSANQYGAPQSPAHQAYPPGSPQSYPGAQGYSPNTSVLSAEQLAQLYQVAPGEPPLPPPSVTGTRKAVIIGINYLHQTQGRLKGCIPDANNIEQFLLTRGYLPANIRKLTDDSQNYYFVPTKANMLQAMQWLVTDVRPGDSLFFHYSGHGGQEPDPTGLEEDGLNETVLPVDWAQNGMINDDTIHNILVRPLPPGVRLTAIFDSCHSGTAMDLPYIYHAEDKAYKNAHLKDDAFSNKIKKDPFKALISLPAAATNELLSKNKRAAIKERLIQQNTSKAMVMMIAGCRDEQKSADLTVQGTATATGAMSWAFIQALNANPNHTWASLIKSMRDFLHQKGFQQMPQMSMGRRVTPYLPVVF